MNWFKKNFFVILLILIIGLFNHQFFIKGKLPVPSDTIVGMYHPYRDKIWDNFANGVPFKNPLITDPVRQQYVWRDYSISQVKKGTIPVWNPYSFSGTPLIANFQSSVFYPLNILYYFFPTHLAWAWQVIISQLLVGVFLYYYLKNMNIHQAASFLGSLSFLFSGFIVSWLTWNTIVHVTAWTILALLSIDKIIASRSKIWYPIFLFSVISAFLAGHLQIFFYGFILINFYLLYRLLFLSKDKFSIFMKFVICYLLFIFLTLPQSIPTINFIKDSARDIDQGHWNKTGWFIPWQHLIQFIAPDYFGNPVTGNYFGIWNYSEFIGFIGTFPLIFSLFALLFIRSTQVKFFSLALIISLLLATPTLFAKIPYISSLPLISTSQPTRLLFLMDLSLSILAAFGFNFFLHMVKKGNIFKILMPFWLIFVLLLFFSENPVSRRNLILPFVMILISSVLLSITVIRNKMSKITNPDKIFILLMLSLTVFDLLRFAWKFTPFTPQKWLFPQTEIIARMTGDNSIFRIMSLDRRIMPPNFSVFYNLQDVSGYDPLYLRNYNILVSSWNSDIPQNSPGAFNRIVTPDNWKSKITDLLNVKYILSLSPIVSDKLKLILKEGDTYLYLNNNFFPRVWLAENIIKVSNAGEELEKLFDQNLDLNSTVITTENLNFNASPASEIDNSEVILWSANKIIVKTKTKSGKILVLSEIYHPAWKAKVDGKISRIYKVDFTLRGIPLTGGDHTVELFTELL